MPRNSDRLHFLQDLDLNLITSLCYFKNNWRKLPTRRIVASHSSLSFLLLFILALVNSLPNVTILLRVLEWVISCRHQELTHIIELKHLQLKVKTWQRTSALVMDTFDLVLKHCYMIFRVGQPRIATMACTVEVMLQNNETFFQRWVSHLWGVCRLPCHVIDELL